MTRFNDTTPSRINAGTGPFDTGAANEIYHHYYTWLLGITTTRFRWLGLGPWIDPARLEFLLITRGLCAFTFVGGAKDPLPDILTQSRTDYYTGQQVAGKEIFPDRFTITQANVTGYLDDTYTPAGYQTHAPNGAGGIRFNTLNTLDKWRGIPIWGDSNRSMYDAYTIAFFAARLASATLAVDTNLKMTMRGPMVATTQDGLKSKQIALEGGLAGIDTFVATQESIDSLKALDMGVKPEQVSESHRVFTRIRSEAIQALGINAPGAEKQERKITDEIDGDEAQTLAIRRLAYAPRRRAVDLINKRYFNGDTVVEVVDQW